MEYSGFFSFLIDTFFYQINKGIGSVSNSLDTDQARHVSNFVWPDLGLNCLGCSSADETSR